MYSSTYGQADGGSLFGGAGFMPSQSATQSADAGSSKRSGSQNTGLLPLTVKQISQAVQKPSDDNFYVDGVDVNNVTLVGMVFDKMERSTDVSFYLDDGTGRIEIKRWIDGQDTYESMEMNSIQNGVYVRVHGHLKSFQDRKNIVAFSVRPITDFNEVTFHFLECIFVHLHNLKTTGSQISIGTKTPAVLQGSHAAQGPTSTYGAPSSAGYGGGYNQYMPNNMASVGGTMDECQKRVHAIFEEPTSLNAEAGLHVDEVARRMVGFNKKQVKDAIEFLVNEGLIYSTIDDDHYKSTNG